MLQASQGVRAAEQQGCNVGAVGQQGGTDPGGRVAGLQGSQGITTEGQQGCSAAGKQCYRPGRAAGLRVQGGKAASLSGLQGCRTLRA